MSLAFLFKKTWHPSTLQNSERVWVAEQKDAAEKRRIEELTKRVREEQQVRELEEMQVSSREQYTTSVSAAVVLVNDQR